LKNNLDINKRVEIFVSSIVVSSSQKKIAKEIFVVIYCFHSQMQLFEFEQYHGRAKENNILLMKTKIIAKQTGLSKPIQNECSHALIKDTSDSLLTKLHSYYEHNKDK